MDWKLVDSRGGNKMKVGGILMQKFVIRVDRSEAWDRLNFQRW